MSQRNPELLDAFKTFDSATIFNALVRKFGLPNEEYSDHSIRCLLELEKLDRINDLILLLNES